eukprot:gnl/TRDRNA2_/TRDRNA2_36848_c0_seq1.p1 gnl/TRDRNA2_/TRDRNA2_36848_c0~~gnl/TRDRNA2_/TRDRNA2_36848_c0_seq1.p1  ORF type:complete len:321 (+),score=76.30 gnl/TRDRNA2_/TRDRNA2_36848_c0_seq1:47-1009(+)
MDLHICLIITFFVACCYKGLAQGATSVCKQKAASTHAAAFSEDEAALLQLQVSGSLKPMQNQSAEVVEDSPHHARGGGEHHRRHSVHHTESKDSEVLDDEEEDPSNSIEYEANPDEEVLDDEEEDPSNSIEYEANPDEEELIQEAEVKEPTEHKRSKRGQHRHEYSHGHDMKHKEPRKKIEKQQHRSKPQIRSKPEVEQDLVQIKQQSSASSRPTQKRAQSNSTHKQAPDLNEEERKALDEASEGKDKRKEAMDASPGQSILGMISQKTLQSYFDMNDGFSFAIEVGSWLLGFWSLIVAGIACAMDVIGTMSHWVSCGLV